MALMVLEGSGDSKRRDQRVGARGASSLKVTDAFWYALLAFLVTGSTWGYTSDDIWYLIEMCIRDRLRAVRVRRAATQPRTGCRGVCDAARSGRRPRRRR